MKKLSLFLCSVGLLANGALADSLWHAEPSRSMFADRRATAIGDIVTIIVQESSTAEKDNSTKTSRQSDIDASIATFLYSPAASGLLTHNGKLPALKVAGKNSFSGGGSINNSEKIITRIPVRVIDVLPNDNLVIEGTRHTSFSGESQDVVLRGVIRPNDVAANNTIFSYHVADATIKIVNKGTVSDTQRKGWFTRVWDVVNPF